MGSAVNRNDLYSENPELENRKPGEQESTRVLFSSKAESDLANFLLEKPRLYIVSLRPGSFVGSSCLK